MKQQINTILDELSKLGVHDLREIARSYGVFAPTLLKREELLEKINAKMGGKDPNQGRAPTKRGRPPKTKFISKIRVDIPSKLAFMSDAVFSNDCFQSLTDFEAALFLKEDSDSVAYNAMVSGVMQSVNNGESNYFYAMNKQTKKFESVVFVPKIFITEYSLHIGDKIKGSAIASDTQHVMMLTSILQVNDMEPKNSVTRELHGFEDGLLPTESVALKDFSVLKGERVLLSYQNKTEQFIKANQLAQELTSHFDKVIFVGIELVQEFFAMAKNAKKVETMIAEYGDTLSVSCNVILSSTDYAQALLGEGLNVAIVFYDILAQANILETKLGQFENENVYGFREKTTSQMKRAFSIAKASSNSDGSITSFVTCQENELQNNLIDNIFVKVASKIINN